MLSLITRQRHKLLVCYPTIISKLDKSPWSFDIVRCKFKSCNHLRSCLQEASSVHNFLPNSKLPLLLPNMNRVLLQTCPRLARSKLSTFKKSYLPLANTVFVRNNATDSAKTVLFPVRDEFPERHIGPRDHDVITMLDLLGYKVRKTFFRFILHYYCKFIACLCVKNFIPLKKTV